MPNTKDRFRQTGKIIFVLFLCHHQVAASCGRYFGQQSKQPSMTARHEVLGYAKEVGRGRTYVLNADRRVYLASTFKIYVIISVLNELRLGRIGRGDVVTVTNDTFVDGSPKLNPKNFRTGDRVSVQDLITWMMQFSDNAATDALIRLVTTERLNEVKSLIGPSSVGELIPMLEARRRLWSGLDPRSRNLTGSDFIDLKNEKDVEKKLELFAKKIGSDRRFTPLEYEEAQKYFFTAGHNTTTLRDLGRLIERLALGKVITQELSREVLATMAECKTGEDRLKAGLPPGTTFAHKTGTLDPMMLDFGVAEVDGRLFVLAGSVQNFRNRPEAAKSLEDFSREQLARLLSR